MSAVIKLLSSEHHLKFTFAFIKVSELRLAAEMILKFKFHFRRAEFRMSNVPQEIPRISPPQGASIRACQRQDFQMRLFIMLEEVFVKAQLIQALENPRE